MVFLGLPTEVIVLIVILDLDFELDRGRPKGLLLPLDRFIPHHDISHEIPSCLTPCAHEDRALSGQATACVEDRGQSLPRIFEWCHICSSLRTLVMDSPLLWASQALCWPARNEHVLARTRECSLSLVSGVGLCACIYSDVGPLLHRAVRIGLVLPSMYIRVDGTPLSTSSLVREEVIRAYQLTEVELRFDGHFWDKSPALSPVIIPGLRCARLQNSKFTFAGPSLQVLQIAAEPGAPAFTLPQLLDVIRLSENLKELVIQNAVTGSYWLPWEVDYGARLSLPQLEHLTCSGHRGLTRAVLYWVHIPPAVDMHVDVDFLLGSTARPFERFPAQLDAELSALLHPALTRSKLDYARAWAEAESADTPFQSDPPDSWESPDGRPQLPYLAIDVICDSESEDPLGMWPRLMTIVAAQDHEGACKSVAPFGDPTSLGPGRLRRTFTMRNSHAAFPNDAQAALREALPHHFRPSHLGQAVSLPLTAFLSQADAEEAVCHLTLTSWVPRTEDEWRFILADLPQLRVIEVLSPVGCESIRSLALYLWRERGNEELRDIAFSGSGMERTAALALQTEVHRLMVAREASDSLDSNLPHIIWCLV